MGKKKKILVLAGTLRSLINFRGPLLFQMVKYGHTVIAAAPVDENFVEIKNILLKIGVKLTTIPLARASVNPWHDLKSYLTLINLYRSIKPDIVFAYTVKPVIYGGIAARKVGGINFYPMITGLGYAFTKSGGIKQRIIKSFVSFLYRQALVAADTVIFHNPDDETLFKKLNIQSKKTPSALVNGSGVDLVDFPFVSLPSSPVFLMLSRLLVDKGVREYVEAARKVKKKYPETIFRLGGRLDKNPTSIKSAELKDWVDEEVIEYLGTLLSVQAALAACKFYVLPSYREGTPRSVIEALATGRPIITTDVPGCRETVVHGKNGLLVAPRNSDALAKAMIQLIETCHGDIQRMGNKSFEIARDKYDVKNVNNKMLQIMRLSN